MPYVQGGGLFVRTEQAYDFGSPINLLVQLPEEEDNYIIEGKVIWITPKGAQGNKPTGIGIQLIGENTTLLCNKIETYLAGMLKSAQITDTF